MKKVLAILLAVMVLGMFSTVDVSAKKRTRSKARTTKVKKSKGNRTCPSCKGSGEIWIYSGWGVGHIKGCTRCGGSGYAVTDRMGEIMDNHGLRRGRGRI